MQKRVKDKKRSEKEMQKKDTNKDEKRNTYHVASMA